MSANSLTIWGVGTPRTFRPHWTLHEIGLEYETHPLGSRTGETQEAAFLQLNARGKIPVLRDGGLVMAESAAIAQYLADRYGQELGLSYPLGSAERALSDQWSYFALTELDAHTLYVVRKHRDLADLYGEAPAAIEEAQNGFDRQIAVAARALEDGRDHLLGERFCVADIHLGSVLDWAEAYEIDLPGSLPAYHDRLKARPAYQSAFELNYRSRPEVSPFS